MRAALRAAKVDFSDCFELEELTARFHSAMALSAVNSVETLRLKANGAFNRTSYAFSVRLYTLAIAEAEALRACDPARSADLLGPLLSNRSAAYRALRMPAQALADAREAVRRAPGFLKGHVRLAQALHAVGRSAQALQAADAGALSAMSSSTHTEDGRCAKEAEEIVQLRASILGSMEADKADSSGVGGRSSPGNDISVRLSDPGASQGLEGSEHSENEQSSLAGSALLLHMPEDALTSILGLLAMADLSRAMRACTALLRLTSANGMDSVWHCVCARDFPEFTRRAVNADGGLDAGACLSTNGALAAVGRGGAASLSGGAGVSHGVSGAGGGGASLTGSSSVNAHLQLVKKIPKPKNKRGDYRMTLSLSAFAGTTCFSGQQPSKRCTLRPTTALRPRQLRALLITEMPEPNHREHCRMIPPPVFTPSTQQRKDTQ
jgi:tetratricopeptide (TPR) repeat protein